MEISKKIQEKEAQIAKLKEEIETLEKEQVAELSNLAESYLHKWYFYVTHWYKCYFKPTSYTVQGKYITFYGPYVEYNDSEFHLQRTNYSVLSKEETEANFAHTIDSFPLEIIVTNIFDRINNETSTN